MLRVKVDHHSVKEPLTLKWLQWNHQVNSVRNIYIYIPERGYFWQPLSFGGLNKGDEGLRNVY